MVSGQCSARPLGDACYQRERLRVGDRRSGIARTVTIHYSLLIIALSLPFVLWGVCGILPTFDDYTTLQSPQFTPLWSEGLLPNNGFWRPFDYLFGWLLGRFTWLFPWFNHVVIIVGHTLSTLLIYSICRRLSLGTMGAHVSTLFFFFSPATLGATLAVDGLNQTYAQFWGLVALTLYLRTTSFPRCVFFLLLAALSKENGLAWAVVLPLVAFAFGLNDKKRTLRHVFYGLLFIVLYLVVRVMLNPHQTVGEEYLATTPLEHLKDVLQLLVYTWLPVDYASIVYAPARCWPLAIATLLLALPFIVYLIYKVGLQITKGERQRASLCLLILIACYFILAAPHLLTVASIMHNYAPLSMAALIVASLLSPSPAKASPGQGRFLLRQASLGAERGVGSVACKAIILGFFIAILITDVHHLQAARASGQLSRQMAMEVIDSFSPSSHDLGIPKRSARPRVDEQRSGMARTVNGPLGPLGTLATSGKGYGSATEGRESQERSMVNVFCISVSSTDDMPGYSSFYVRPVDAFAWGLSVRHYTHYQYPAQLRDTTLSNPTPNELRHVADSALNAGASSVWIVTDSCYHVSVYTNSQF